MFNATRRDFLRTLGTGAAAVSLPQLMSSCAPSDAPRPNILFIMTDDHASQAISAYGSRINKTPHIDRLASEGVRFENCFATNAICAPSRASILTGTYSHVNGVIDNNVVFDGEQLTFPKLLQEAGYETALFGKWHLKSSPTGFNHWDILPGQGHYYNPDFIRNGEKRRVEGYVTDLTTDLCLDWLDNRNADQPFCVMLHHKAPHRNWMPALRHLHLYDDEDIPVPETFDDDYTTRSDAARDQDMSIEETLMPANDLKADAGTDQDAKYWKWNYDRMTPEQKKAWDAAYTSRNTAARRAGHKGADLKHWKYQRYIKDYLRCIAAVDENIGRVLDYLDENGLSENTVVVYTSDQGFFLGEHGWFDKRFMYEESLRMPMIVRYPKEISAGRVEKGLAANVDFAPTFLDYAGINAPQRMQGRSLRPLLKGKTSYDWRKAVYYHYFEYPGPHGVKRHYGLRTDRYKLIRFYHDIDAWEMYDLREDPNELNNLAAVPTYSVLFKKLKRELKRLRKVHGDDGMKRFLPGKPKKIEHLAVGASIALTYSYSPKYPGSGPGGLVDGIKAPENVGSQADLSLWQGIEGVELEAVVDLGGHRPVKNVTVGFLEQTGSWIFMPQTVEVSVSEDGKQWSKAEVWRNQEKMQSGPAVRRSVRLQLDGREVRFIKVKAQSQGVCPQWHPGAGKVCWLFADEIVVE